MPPPEPTRPPDEPKAPSMRTAKQEVAELLRSLPEDSTLEDIQYHLYLLEKTRKGRKDIARGRAYTNGEAKQRLDRWLES